MTKKINWLLLLSAIAITELTGFISNLFSGDVKQTYLAFSKPLLSPPHWLFGIVWPILYFLMAVALYIVSQEAESSSRKEAIPLYWLQLFINFIWPIIFFRFQLLWISVFIIVVLDILVCFTLLKFYKIKKIAGYLLVPYLLWILFATYLNIGIAILN